MGKGLATRLAAALASLFVVSTASAVQPPRLFVLPLGQGGVSADVAHALDAVLVAEASKLKLGYEVVAAADLEAMLGLEKMKDVLGCDDVVCATELGAALGADHLLLGSVSRLGSTIFISLTLYDVRAQRSLNRALVERDYDADAFLPALRAAARDLFVAQSGASPTSSGSSLSSATGEQLWLSRLAWLSRAEVTCHTLEQCKSATQARVEEIERLLTRVAWRTQDEVHRPALAQRLAELKRQLSALETALLQAPPVNAAPDTHAESGPARVEGTAELLLRREALGRRLRNTTWTWSNRDEKTALETQLARLDALIEGAQKSGPTAAPLQSDAAIRLMVELDGLRSRLSTTIWGWENRDEKSRLEERIRACEEQLARLRANGPTSHTSAQ